MKYNVKVIFQVDLKLNCKKKFFLSLWGACYKYGIMTSRGCPYNCSYCFNSFMHKSRGNNPVRQRSVDNVISELVLAKARYPLKYITFYDDCFVRDADWTEEFCRRYKKPRFYSVYSGFEN